MEHMWGDRVWQGLAQMFFNQYQYAYLFSNDATRLTVGWFLCPSNFGRANAQAAATQGDRFWFPAVFEDTDDPYTIRMACLNIVINSSRPWWVHRSRVHNTVTITVYVR